MYIMYSLLCYGTGKRIHNIDILEFGVVCFCCAVAQVNIYII